LLGWAKVTAHWSDAPSAEAVFAKDEERMLKSPDWDAPVGDADRELIEKLTAAFSPEQMAAAVLRHFRERHTAPEELSEVNAPRPASAAFGPSQWFSLPGGRAAGAEPKRLLPMLCKLGDLSRDDIGAIRIQPDTALIEIRTSAVPGLLAALGPSMSLENGAVLSALKNPPSFDRAPRRAAPSPAKPPFAPKRKLEETPGTTQPVDWNDAPAPKPKRPKQKAKPGAGKSARKTGSFPPKDKAEKPRSTDAGNPGKPPGKKERARGPKPPVGKPSSKKNRARKQAAQKFGGTAPAKR
jgi:ATP-dependent RNA helicase DeaD